MYDCAVLYLEQFKKQMLREADLQGYKKIYAKSVQTKYVCHDHYYLMKEIFVQIENC